MSFVQVFNLSLPFVSVVLVLRKLEGIKPLGPLFLPVEKLLALLVLLLPLLLSPVLDGNVLERASFTALDTALLIASLMLLLSTLLTSKTCMW